jgi:type I restriction enzyme, S subunit
VSWKTKKLSDLYDIQIGKTPSRANQRYFGTGFPWLSIADMKEVNINHTKEEITHEAVENSNMKLIPKSTVVMSFKLSIGKIGVLQRDMYTNEAIAAFLPKTYEIDNLFLRYALNVINFNESTDRAVMGATLNKKKLQEIKISFPSIVEQRKIAFILDKIQVLIEKRNEAIKKLDELLQSVFFDMFGDLSNNSKEWHECAIEDVCTEIVDCINRTAPIVDCETEFKMIRTSNIKKGNIDTKLTNFVDKETYEKWTRRLVPIQGDILFTREAPVGEAGLVRSDEKIFLGQRIMHYRPNSKKVNPHYLLFQLMDRSLEKQINNLASGSTVKHLSVNDCKKFKIKLPPMELQNQFEIFMKKVEKQKEVNHELQIKYQSIYNSLLQKAFKGELTIKEEVNIK